MAKKIPTSGAKEAAAQTRSKLSEIESFHDKAESAAARGESLDASGDQSGAEKAYADHYNDQANAVADEVQSTVGSNHTVNSDGTITFNKVAPGAAGFSGSQADNEATLTSQTDPTAAEVVLAGADATSETSEAISENQTEASQQEAVNQVADLLRADGIDPGKATAGQINQVLQKKTLSDQGVLDKIKDAGGDPDSMTAAELNDAATAVLDEVEVEAERGPQGPSSETAEPGARGMEGDPDNDPTGGTEEEPETIEGAEMTDMPEVDAKVDKGGLGRNTIPDGPRDNLEGEGLGDPTESDLIAPPDGTEGHAPGLGSEAPGKSGDTLGLLPDEGKAPTATTSRAGRVTAMSVADRLRSPAPVRGLARAPTTPLTR